MQRRLQNIFGERVRARPLSFSTLEHALANRMVPHTVRQWSVQSGDPAVSNQSQLAPARIMVRSSPVFYQTLKNAARRAQLSVSDYTRLAIAERMALDELGVAVLRNERQQNG